jgi:pyruvate/2-oxoacid:ferredoxin oxidoreductase alpha subunit
MCGNEALGEAAILAGCDAYFGYPCFTSKTPRNRIYVASYLWHFAESSLRVDLRYLRIPAETRSLCSKR